MKTIFTICFFFSLFIFPSISVAQQYKCIPKPPPEWDLGSTSVQRSQVIIQNVPSYLWLHGCAPTALGMAVGYLDNTLYPELISGDAHTQTSEVDSAIANSSHFNDYSLPLDYPPNIILDKSNLGGAHSSNCIADFMRTSWSSANNCYGSSWTVDLETAFESYVNMIYPELFPACSPIYVTNSFGWNDYKNEIDNNCPVVMSVDPDGDGIIDHAVVGIGYDEANHQYGIYNTWDNNIHWLPWRPVGAGITWGISDFRRMDISVSSDWNQVNNGLTDLDIRCLAINSDDEIFAGVHTQGIFRSVDDGNSWVAVNNGFYHNVVYCLAINSNNHIFAGTSPYGVYRSTDNGESWSQAAAGLTSPTILSLAIDNLDYVFAGTYTDGIYRSTNNGNNWVQVNNGLLDSDIEVLKVGTNNTIYAGTRHHGLFRSTDHGDTWTQINGNFSNSWIPAITANTNGDVYAEFWGEGIFKSIDNGNTWVPLNMGLPAYSMALTYNSLGHILGGTYENGVVRSIDNGEHWEELSHGLSNKYILCLAVNSAGFIFGGTNTRGIYRSTRSSIPVELISLTTHISNNGQIELFWETATETNNRGFEIEHAKCGSGDTTWNMIGYIPGNGTSSQKNSYHFAYNEEFSGGILYRLKQIDFNGAYEYSRIVETDIKAPINFSLKQNFPNPFNPSTTIEYQISEIAYVTLKIYDILGSEIRNLVNEEKSAGTYKVSFSAQNLASGIYFYRIDARSRISNKQYGKVGKMILLK